MQSIEHVFLVHFPVLTFCSNLPELRTRQKGRLPARLSRCCSHSLGPVVHLANNNKFHEKHTVGRHMTNAKKKIVVQWSKRTSDKNKKYTRTFDRIQ